MARCTRPSICTEGRAGEAVGRWGGQGEHTPRSAAGELAFPPRHTHTHKQENKTRPTCSLLKVKWLSSHSRASLMSLISCGPRQAGVQNIRTAVSEHRSEKRTRQAQLRQAVVRPLHTPPPQSASQPHRATRTRSTMGSEKSSRMVTRIILTCSAPSGAL